MSAPSDGAKRGRSWVDPANCGRAPRLSEDGRPFGRPLARGDAVNQRIYRARLDGNANGARPDETAT